MSELILLTKLSPEQNDFAHSIKSSAQALLTIINDILDFSKIEAGKLDLEFLNFDLRLAIEEMIDILAIRCNERKNELICLIESDVPSLLIGDPGRLRQILTNLIGNSIKFTENGEMALKISLDSEEDDRATIRFEVNDTGNRYSQG